MTNIILEQVHFIFFSCNLEDQITLFTENNLLRSLCIMKGILLFGGFFLTIFESYYNLGSRGGAYPGVLDLYGRGQVPTIQMRVG